MRIALISALFLLGLVVPPFLRWLRMRRWGLPVRVVVDPADPLPEDICGYFAEIACRLDERPERMRVVFDGRNSRNRAISLDVEADRALRVSVEGHRPRRVDLRGRWIPDHPVPLPLKKAVLFVEPVDANRFRVMTSIPFSIPMVVYVACSLLATLGLVFVLPELLAAAVGTTLGGILSSDSFFRFLTKPH